MEIMDFDKSKVYTALNADELKIGSKVIVAYDLKTLKNLVSINDERVIHNLVKVYDESNYSRFVVDNGCCYAYSLAYLVEEPEKLRWTDLKIGDIIRNSKDKITAMVTRIDSDDSNCHIYIANQGVYDGELDEWEKVND